MSGYSRLSGKQLGVLVKYTKGRVVHDLGAGALGLARILIDHGACKVIAIDKEPISLAKDDPCIEIEWMLFSDYKEPIDTAVVSWPINHYDQGLLTLVERSRRVIYIGKNTDGSMCGWPGLFWSFLSRKLLAYIPDRKNALIVYGDRLKDRSFAGLRRPVGEELAGLTTYEKMFSYEDAEAEAARGS